MCHSCLITQACAISVLFSHRPEVLWRHKPHLIHVWLSHSALHKAKVSIYICWNKSYIQNSLLKWHTSTYLCSVSSAYAAYVGWMYVSMQACPLDVWSPKHFLGHLSVTLDILLPQMWFFHLLALWLGQAALSRWVLFLTNWDNNNACSINCCQIMY